MTDVKDRRINLSSTIQPSKRLGQNFLHDAGVIKKIIGAFAPDQHETVVEIGPGTGALTIFLVERVARIIAIEFDKKLASPLLEAFGDKSNFELVQADALETDLCALISPAPTARLIANLPYNISTAILQKLILQRRCLTEMVLMLQKEVVDRIQARAGSSERGYLSVLVEAYCDTEKLFDVAPGSFRPAPKIWSSVIRLTFKTNPQPLNTNESLLWATVSAGFAQKRKTILNNLRNSSGHLLEVIQRNGGASIVLCKAEVDLQRRAETLSIDEWVRITQAMT
jgi:16S rRNA (adenine1518-N6/adenine1519-N6)-dimethyltransferase